MKRERSKKRGNMPKVESAMKRGADELPRPWTPVEGKLAFISKTLSSVTQIANRFSKTKQTSS